MLLLSILAAIGIVIGIYVGCFLHGGNSAHNTIIQSINKLMSKITHSEEGGREGLRSTFLHFYVLVLQSAVLLFFIFTALPAATQVMFEVRAREQRIADAGRSKASPA